MWYYLVRYSFDADKSVFGPFNRMEDAWYEALANASKELYIDEHENGWNSEMSKYEDIGEIVLVNHFPDRDDTTEYLIFEI